MENTVLHQVLSALMKERRMNARSLAKAIGLPLSTLQSYLAGPKKTYSPVHLQQISSFFGVSIDRLLFGKSQGGEHPHEMVLEDVYEGWLRVKIERAIPTKKGGSK